MPERETVKKALRTRKPTRTIKPSDYLRTGSTLLDLACTGTVLGGLIKGHYFFLVGDSTSGKTFLALTCLAEAALNKSFAEHRFIFDNAEDGALMNIALFFGKAVAKRLEPPAVDEDGRPAPSRSIQDFYYNVDDAIKDGRPFIYILDSMDAISSREEEEKFTEQKKASRTNKKVKGSYGDGKAKQNSSNLRRVVGKLLETDSILIIINQTRDNPAAGPFEPTKTRSGGRSLTFYATLELWSSVIGHMTKTIRGKKREQGIIARVKVKKNRATGAVRYADIPIYHSHGIDDIGGCVDWLVSEGHWPKNNAGFINAKDYDWKMRRDQLIERIEREGLEEDLKDITQTIWQEIEAACKIKRKRRYH